MSQLPITSRVKRSPAKSQSSGAVNPDEPVKGYFSTPGEDTTTTEEVTTKGKVIKASKQRCGIEVDWSDPRCVAYKKMSKEDIEASEVKQGLRTPDKVETKTTVEKGEPTTGSVDLKASQKSDVMQPWEVARLNRSNKKLTRNLTKAQSNIERYKDSTSRYGKRKYAEAKLRAANAQQMYDTQTKAQASGKRGGSSNVTGLDRNKTAGDYTDKEQIEKAKQAQESKKKEKTSNMFKGFVEKASAFPMRSDSPAKKALVGKQNQLPPQLKASIKAAPGKMKASGFKMNGYGSKK